MEGNDIEPQDLVALEKCLEREEIVSLMFLLNGDKPDNILEKLSDVKSGNFLYDFAIDNNQWKTLITQALTATKSFGILHNLGISKKVALKDFDTNKKINPGLVLLFQLCESCSSEKLKSFEKHIKENCEPANQCQEPLLEFFLLHSISSGLIKLGTTLNTCDFSFITKYFESNKSEDVDAILRNLTLQPNGAIDNLNDKPVNMTNMTSKPLNCLEEYQTNNMQVLIINQESFYQEKNPQLVDRLPGHVLTERKGTKHDVTALQDLFEGFGYKVTIKKNLIHSDILKEVEKYSKQASQVDGFIVCIMSHGQKGVIYGHNSIEVKVDEIKAIMATDRLLNKPKILFIQACQGANLQKTVQKDVRRLEHDGPGPSMMRTSGLPMADFLTFWSTVEHFASIRDIDKGSWFFQELVKKIRELHREHHLNDICTAVVSGVSNKKAAKNVRMLPKLETTFGKIFRFPRA